jgi:hypothetical protein
MDSPLTDFNLDYLINEVDKAYRGNFFDLIKQTKLLTHKCQYECYNTNINDLNKLEDCARKCFKPLVYIKKNVSTLVENHKENFEKCKINARAKFSESKYLNQELNRCVETYSKNLNNSKDEIEYIYKGYMKNLNI